ncbi:ribosomal-protein-alanine N-acetyltransferase [Chitinivorax tropicus]|uniref:Ribosomal-protein-alanine N-acetyltransferase n=1 Tax=Chitinivorax tropicus TaxID=714531 RepID=A0A840MT61_9PROT|nr:GNAT family N-acetyltransferase [Chitinivorax tropicus]MBB5020397.1 ribosomal-protein-alanine N-acetyltransferase [Chitinivorax tropicus]
MSFLLSTSRLVLRDWQDSDLEPWVAMNADAMVRRYFPTIASREQAIVEMQRFREHGERHGFTLWPLEIPGQTAFAGVVGLFRTPIEAHFTPCVEIGWRLAIPYWGQGYATEAARLALQYGFDTLQLAEIVALTAADNQPSRAVMARIGMQHNAADDFDHPRVADGHPLKRHVLYRIQHRDWCNPFMKHATESGHST